MKTKEQMINADNLNDKINVGTILENGKKKYIIVEINIINMGHTKEFHLIRIYDSYSPTIRVVRFVYDTDIARYKIVKY